MQIHLPEGVKKIIDVLEKNGQEAFAVGGCVRDSLLQKQPKDFDITTSAKPQTVKQLFRKTVDTGIQHGTVTVLLNGESYEVTTYRVDGIYEDGRHPKEVTFSANLSEDLRRRDFTINAMAYNDREGLVDLYGGEEDLRNGCIRCVGDAEERFSEDALRILRAFRFSAQLGFTIEEKTLAAAEKLSDTLQKISAERIFTELRKTLTGKHPERLLLMYEKGITKWFLPEFDQMAETSQNHPAHYSNVAKHTIDAVCSVRTESEYAPHGEFTEREYEILRLSALLHDVGKPSCRTTDEKGIEHFYNHEKTGALMVSGILHRLKADNETIHAVKNLVRYHSGKLSEDEITVRKMIQSVGKELCPLFFELRYADLCAHADPYKENGHRLLSQMYQVYRRILERGDCLDLKTLAVKGQDLIQAGVPAGPKLGEYLNAMLRFVTVYPEKNQKDELLSRLSQFEKTKS